MMQADKQAPVGEKDKKTSSLRRFAPIVVIVVFMLVAFSMGWHKYLSLSSLIENQERLHTFVLDNYFVALFLFFMAYVVSVALSLPGASILTILGGFVFGWLVGGFLTVFSATLGALALFFAVKTALGDALRKKAGPFINKLADGFREDAFNYLLFLRLVPAFPFWLVNIAPAILGVNVRTYTIATFFGIIPGTFAFSFIGAGIVSVIEEQRAANTECIGNAECEVTLSLSSLVTKELLLAFAVLGVVSVIPVVLKKIKARKTP